MRQILNCGNHPYDDTAEPVTSGLHKIAMMLAELHGVEFDAAQFTGVEMYFAFREIDRLFEQIYARKQPVEKTGN